jgi:hypothetical protein
LKIERPGEPKVADLEEAFLVDEQILRLHIPVHEAIAVEIADPAKKLNGVRFEKRRGQTRSQLAQVFLQIMIQILCDKVRHPFERITFLSPTML